MFGFPIVLEKMAANFVQNGMLLENRTPLKNQAEGYHWLLYLSENWTICLAFERVLFITVVIQLLDRTTQIEDKSISGI